MIRAMKDSGIEWIGEIPQGWNVIRLRYLGELNSSGVDKKMRESEKKYKSIHYVDVYRNSLHEITSSDKYLEISASDDKAAACKLRAGDVLFTNSSETPDDIGCSTVISEDLDDTLFGYHLMRFRPTEKMYLPFEKYLFGNQYIRNWFAYNANGITRYGVNYNTFADAWIFIPDYDEQQLIADYLDKKCAEIDTVIVSKQKANELLKEQRQSIIYEAVTKGLDKNPPMKDSGIEWIGQIPRLWSVKKVKYVADIDSHKLSEKTNAEFEFEYVDIGSVTDVGGIGVTTVMTFEKSPSRARMVVRKGDTIVSTVRTYLKAIAYIHESDKYICSTGFCVLSPMREINSRYLYYQVQSEYFVQCIISESVGVSYPAINSTEVGEIKIVIPDIDEQQSIADYLDRKCAEFDQLMQANNTTIEKLKEYRQSVIYEAATGKAEIN